MTENEIRQVVKKCTNVINQKFESTNIVMVCILKGAAYFYVDLTRELTIPHSCYFIEATSYHDSQSQTGLSIFSSIVPEKFIDKHVIIVDELFDNGETLNNIKSAIHTKANVPLEMIFTCTAFKKNKETKYQLPDLCGISLPDVWVVGYGLDNKQENRHFKNLYAIPKDGNVTKTDDDKIFDDEELWGKMRCDIATGLIF